MSSCPACGDAGGAVFWEQHGVPVQSVALLPSWKEAVAFPRGEIELAVCVRCGFVWNTAWDPALQDYAREAEESQAFSARFRAFSAGLARRLVDRYGIRGKDVLEPGCGRGDFLVELCELGGNRGVGVDPGWRPGRLEHPPAVEFVARPFDDREAAREADLVLCRHTLEHIGPVREFVERLRRPAVARGGIVVIEVPDVLRVLEEAAFWDVYYEHCSYFSDLSLSALARRCGLDVLACEIEFDGQYVVLEARPGEVTETDGDKRVPEAAHRFAARAAAEIEQWRERLAASERPALWGGGSKAVSFLSATGAEHVTVVDVNPFRQGAWLPGVGVHVHPPEQLREAPPDLVVAMNPAYEAEICASLRDLGVSARLETL